MQKKSNLPCGFRQWQVFSLIAKGEKTPIEVSKALDITPVMAYMTLFELKKKGLVRSYRIDPDGKSIKVHYVLTEWAKQWHVVSEQQTTE